jgi:hypothetical protein
MGSEFEDFIILYPKGVCAKHSFYVRVCDDDFDLENSGVREFLCKQKSALLQQI